MFIFIMMAFNHFLCLQIRRPQLNLSETADSTKLAQKMYF